MAGFSGNGTTAAFDGNTGVICDLLMASRKGVKEGTFPAVWGADQRGSQGGHELSSKIIAAASSFRRATVIVPIFTAIGSPPIGP